MPGTNSATTVAVKNTHKCGLRYNH